MRALIAMSGGVDSSVAAYLMKQRGFDCIGVTMKLFSNDGIGCSRAKTCCLLEDVEDARSVAYRLGIPYYVFNFTEDFGRQVIDRFVAAYENGATPNPCIDCNRYLKFERLYRRAAELGCDRVATGHYARIEKQGDRYLLKKASDESKDQSYVLYAMTQEQLAHTDFPCGALSKTQTRQIAEEQGFLNAEKPDSQDICFVPDGDYAAFIRRYTGKCYPDGPFVTTQGTIVGRHRGIIHYTVGQRKGLGISSDRPLYVQSIDATKNTVVLGEDRELFGTELNAVNFNWIAFETPPDILRAKAKIRYRHREQWATVEVTGKSTVHLVFDAPQRAVTRGQAVVLYDGDTVLGGGEIV
ncbi:MAG: tRNA 2-thiouridine(34) synthase MnmA [Faecousia sp.]